MSDTDTLTAQVTRPVTFANKHRRKIVPAGTEVTVSAERIESGATHAYVRLAGTRSYAAVLPVSILTAP